MPRGGVIQDRDGAGLSKAMRKHLGLSQSKVPGCHHSRHRNVIHQPNAVVRFDGVDDAPAILTGGHFRNDPAWDIQPSSAEVAKPCQAADPGQED